MDHTSITSHAAELRDLLRPKRYLINNASRILGQKKNSSWTTKSSQNKMGVQKLAETYFCGLSGAWPFSLTARGIRKSII
jgi:hypothetical protein